MKRTTAGFLSVAALAALAFWAPTVKHGSANLSVVQAQSGCSNAILAGNYVFTYSGYNSKRNNYFTELPIVALGVGTFDGAGNATFSYSDAFNDQIESTIPPDVGSYSVNSDCTFTISDPAAGRTWAGAIIGGGAEWSTILTAGHIAAMSGKKE